MNIEVYKKYELLFNIVYIAQLSILVIGLLTTNKSMVGASIIITAMTICISRFHSLYMKMTYDDNGYNSIQVFYPSCLNIIYIIIGTLLKFSKILFFGAIFVILYLIDTYLPSNISIYLASITLYLLITIFLHEYGLTGLFITTGEANKQIKGYGVSPRDIVDENKIDVTIYKYKRLNKNKTGVDYSEY